MWKIILLVLMMAWLGLSGVYHPRKNIGAYNIVEENERPALLAEKGYKLSI